MRKATKIISVLALALLLVALYFWLLQSENYLAVDNKSNQRLQNVSAEIADNALALGTLPPGASARVALTNVSGDGDVYLSFYGLGRKRVEWRGCHFTNGFAHLRLVVNENDSVTTAEGCNFFG